MHLTIYLLAINILTYGLYWLDKREARRGGWRIPEATLLIAGLIGGTVGGFAAQRIVRHKNRKTRFQLAFWAVTVIQVYLILFPPFVLQKIYLHLFA